ncbi:MAG: hypothetical protein RLZZ352_791 [Pseudomonadota bacterium]|jgi:hypothetical protein
MTTPSIRITLAALTTAALLLSPTTVHAQSRYTYSAPGDEVTDSKTGLTWRRCSEGQTWRGSACTGTAATFTHEGAVTQAKTQVGWRLPNVKELVSIVDKTRSTPAIETTVFPATPSGWYWTATPYAGEASFAWSVSFNVGYVNGNYRNSSLHIRLVR